MRAAVIGTGHYATAVVTQARDIRRLDVPVVADIDIDAAKLALTRARYGEDDIAVCESRGGALRAIERGQPAAVADALLVMDLPLDVVVEATGVPEAGARHAREAIRHGKHVAMVNKETDVTVGPLLKLMADRAGVVYTAVDGDQHGLLMGLVEWARELGLEVVCGGKFRNAEAEWDGEARELVVEGLKLPVSRDEADAFRRIRPGEAGERLQVRRHPAYPNRPYIGNYDVCEMAIAANATGLVPDNPELHCPVLRTGEIPEVMCPIEEGGILGGRGIIDAVTCLRHPIEAPLGGGVFIVVACRNDYSRRILTTKGLISNHRGTVALVYRPYHLCGVETAMSVLCAGLLGVATGAREYLPRVDVFARAEVDLKAGDTVLADHSEALRALMCPAQPLTTDGPLPFYLASGNVLTSDVPDGELITADKVRRPADSVVWALREEQDREFM